MTVEFKTQRTPLLPSIPSEDNWEKFERLVKWRRSILDVIQNHAANVYDDFQMFVGGVNDTAEIDLTLANNILSANLNNANIPLDTIGTPIYVTTLNANSSKHGLLPKLSANASEFLTGVGTWATPSGNHAPANGNATSTANTVVDANQLISVTVLPGGIPLDDLGTPTSNSDLDANASKHGLLPKLSANANEYLDGDGNWTKPPSHAFGTISSNFSPNSNYTATTDGFVLAIVSNSTTLGIYVPYGTYRAVLAFSNVATLSVSCPIKSGETWHVHSANGTPAITWIPAGS